MWIALAAPGAWAATSGPAGSTVPVQAFFDAPDMSEPVLSPQGDAVAVLVRNNAGHRQLAIIDTSDVKRVAIAASFDDADITRVAWADDRRLVFEISHEDEAARYQKGSGLFAVDRDGTGFRTLILTSWEAVPMQTGTNIVSRSLTPDFQFFRTLHDGSGDVVVLHWIGGEMAGNATRYHADWRGSVPMRLNTRTGKTSEIVPTPLPDHAMEWTVDDHGQALAAMSSSAGQSSLMVRDGAGHWLERARFASYGISAKGFNLQGVGADGRIYVTRNLDGGDALFRLDLATGQPEPRAIMSMPGFDFNGDLVQDWRDHKVLGVHYESDAAGTVWLDPAMAALQAKVDARIPGLINRIDPGDCACASRVVVTSSSDRQPPVFYLYGRDDGSLIQIGMERPQIQARQMASTDFMRIKARDGHDLPVYVTQPRGKGPWPAVVLVHGGPHLRGWYWEWDPESQFLASRGYLVVKPEFRGSTGYGSDLFTSGFKQWGLKSQDDIADATRWAFGQGLADPKRTCIAGASYGGYATLMGLVRYGDLYRCGVAWAAVADIQMNYDLWWSDADDDWKGYGMPVLVGDPVKDAAQFVATSPLQQAARIKRPLLLAHGGIDRRVPIEHAERLRDALEANHAPLTWLFYKDEAHGWYNPETRAAFYAAMAQFLDANTGKDPDTGKP
jgi:dienelactone hydrolase